MDKWTIGWCQLLLGLLVLSGCDDGGNATDEEETEDEDIEETETDSNSEMDTTEEISIDDQTVELTTVVAVDALSAEAERLVVVTDSESNVIGSRTVSADATMDVEIGLNRRVSDGETLVVRLHEDGGSDGVFASDEADPPLSNVPEQTFEVTVPENTPDIRLVYQGGVPDYRVTLQPESFSDDIDGLFDPLVTFRSGWRYEINNEVFRAHPWEMIDENGNELLSQEDEGTLEADSDIEWEDSGGVSQFTVTSAVSTQTSNYRCSNHPMSMIGEAEFTE